MKQIFTFGFFHQNPSLVHSKRDYFERLARSLYEREMLMHIYDAMPVEEPMNLPPGGQHQHFSVDPNTYASAPQFAGEITPSMERAARVYSDVFAPCGGSTRYHEQAYRLFAFFDRLLAEKRPDLVICWNSFSPFHRWLRSACGQYNIPVLSAEGCLVPGMVEFDPSGSLGLSWVATHSQAFNALPMSGEAQARVKTFLTNPDALPIAKTRRQESDAFEGGLSRPVVMLAGSALIGAGLTPRWHEHSKANSPLFSDDEDVINTLLPLAKRNKWTLLFKPHPLNAQHIHIHQPPYLINAHRQSALACVHACDAVATIISSLAGMALLKDRPAVLLGRNALWGKGCAYGPETLEEIETSVAQAIQTGLSRAMQTAWRDFVVRMASWCAFSYSKEIEQMLGRGTDIAADFIGMHINSPKTPPLPYPQPQPLQPRTP